MLFVDRSNAGRALKSLEHRGHIERCKDEGDRRTNLVQITAKGREAVAAISKLRMGMVRGFFGELTEEEAGEIVGLLRKACPDENDA
jgi:DNA-binding MarR family transcriptional regulator